MQPTPNTDGPAQRRARRVMQALPLALLLSTFFAVKGTKNAKDVSAQYKEDEHEPPSFAHGLSRRHEGT